MANSVTYSVIGAANPKSELGLSTNVLADEMNVGSSVYFTTNILGTVVDVTSEVVMKLSIFFAVVILGFFGIIWLALSAYSSGMEKQISEITSRISSLDADIAREQQVEEVKEDVDITSIIDEVAQVNVKALKNYDSISTDIPKNIWLTKYYNKLGDKIVIQGIAESIPDIYEYFKNLKVASPESDIKLNDLKVITDDQESEFLKGLYIDSEKDRLYSFEISNTTIEAKPVEQNENGGNENILIKSAPSIEVEKLSKQVKPTSKSSKRTSNRKK